VVVAAAGEALAAEVEEPVAAGIVWVMVAVGAGFGLAVPQAASRPARPASAMPPVTRRAAGVRKGAIGLVLNNAG
jgi:hypothetical protein